MLDKPEGIPGPEDLPDPGQAPFFHGGAQGGQYLPLESPGEYEPFNQAADWRADVAAVSAEVVDLGAEPAPGAYGASRLAERDPWAESGGAGTGFGEWEEGDDASASWLMELDEPASDGAEAGGDEWGDLFDRPAARAAHPLRTWGTRIVLMVVCIGAGVGGAQLYSELREDPSIVGRLGGLLGQPDVPVAEAPASMGGPDPGAPEIPTTAPDPAGSSASRPGTAAPEGGTGAVGPVATASDPSTADPAQPDYEGRHDPTGRLAGGQPDGAGVPPFTASQGQLEPRPFLGTEPLATGDPAAGGTAPGGPQNPDLETRTFPLPVIDTVLVPRVESPLREATAEELAGLWQGGTIPVEAIDGSSKLLTPAVGNVRVILGGGQVFEGRLYAVGDRKVWLDMDLGRLALAGWQIESIEHVLAPEEGGAILGTSDPEALGGLPRVRVRTPGGVFYGRMLSQQGDSVALVTEEGARITVEGADIELAGQSETRVIDFSGAEEPEEPEAPAAPRRPKR